MSKHRNTLVASILIIGALISGFIARNVNSNQVISSFQGTEARAQELNPDRTVALETKSGIVGDAIAEKAIIPEDTGNASHIQVWATAYSSEPSQTDSTPFNTANGTSVHDGIAAANFLPFGTQFKIPAVYGEKVFTVEDRMNAKYNNQRIIDIWMPTKKNAIIFGKQFLTLELL
jgi:3D (Asp-Asp-Asp) domain-containing protein